MFIMDLTEVCGSYALASILSIFKRALSLIQLIGPIIGMVALFINFIKLMGNPEEKKFKNLIRNWAIAIVMLFLLPTIINVFMRLFDDSFTVSDCWNKVDDLYDTAYIELEHNIISLNGEYSFIMNR